MISEVFGQRWLREDRIIADNIANTGDEQCNGTWHRVEVLLQRSEKKLFEDFIWSGIQVSDFDNRVLAGNEWAKLAFKAYQQAPPVQCNHAIAYEQEDIGSTCFRLLQQLSPRGKI